MDLIGPIGSGKKRGYIILSFDHCSKLIGTQVIRRKTESSILSFLRKILDSNQKRPQRILEDSGKEFDNMGPRDLCARENKKLEFALPKHHQTTGSVERAIRTFRHKIRKICEFKQDTWQKLVPNATRAMNFSYHRAISTSPFILKYVHIPIFPIDRELRRTEIKYNREELPKQIIKKGEKYKENIVRGKFLGSCF